MTEQEQASHVIHLVRDWGWDVYQEVAQSGHGGAPRCDIVAVQQKLRWAIECKISLGLSVISQAHFWQTYCHYASVAVKPFTHTRASRLGEQVCKHYGIGILICHNETNVSEYLRPRLNRKAIELKLYEEQRTEGKAGSRDNGYFTEFGSTKKSLIRMVEKNPGIEFSRLILEIDHHYRTLSTAKSCLRKYIGSSVIPELRTEIIDRKLCVFLDNTNNKAVQGSVI